MTESPDANARTLGRGELVHELLVTTQSGRTSAIRLEDSAISVGRSATNTLSFPEDDGLSRRHLTIEKEGGISGSSRTWRARTERL